VLITQQWAKAGLKTPHLFSPQTLPFVFSLGAFEGLLLWYWAALRLGQVLTYAAILAPITVWTGKTALVAASERRFGRK
jgi:oligosaccharyltransferase complex subunit delta (ribophorin II)